MSGEVIEARGSTSLALSTSSCKSLPSRLVSRASAMTNPKIFLSGSMKVNDEYFLYYSSSSFRLFLSRLMIQQILSSSSMCVSTYLR